MAKPRVFISSTYYDLKHIRASLELFVEGLGFEPILSEFGSIPYDSAQPLDESCYREAEASDILVLIIGGRYGSIASSQTSSAGKNVEQQLESITRKEFSKAHDADIPIYVLIEQGVFAEYQTYLRNKDRENVSYAHVDSPDVFRFIDFVYSKQRNNPIQSFEKGSDIEIWLRDQWAGVFQELLRQKKDGAKISALSAQIRQLEAVNSTLKSYLETVLESVSPESSSEVIERENKSLSEAKLIEKLEPNHWFGHMHYVRNDTAHERIALMRQIRSVNEIIPVSEGYYNNTELREYLEPLLDFDDARRDFNQMRDILGLTQVRFTQKFLETLEEKISKLPRKSFSPNPLDG